MSDAIAELRAKRDAAAKAGDHGTSLILNDRIRAMKRSQECRYCGELIADLESAPKDSMGAYCIDCEIEDVLQNALNDAASNDEGRVAAGTLTRLLAKEGMAVVKVAVPAGPNGAVSPDPAPGKPEDV